MRARIIGLLSTLVILVLTGTIVYGKLALLDPAQSEIGLLRHEVSLLEQAMQIRGKHIVVLTKNLETTLSRASKLAEENLSLATEVQNTISELEQYDLQVRESMAWFTRNQSIAGLSVYNSLSSALEDNCLQISANQCTIKLSCLSQENGKNNIKYQLDTDTSQRDDYLQDLSATKSHGGGDCEDFSVLVDAELSLLEQRCTDAGASTIRYQGFDEKSGSNHQVSFSDNLFIVDAVDAEIPTASQHHTMICGNFPAALFEGSIVTSETSEFGHCLLAFSPAPLQRSEDVPAFLASATMVEPQTGQLLGTIKNAAIQIPTDDFPVAGAFIFMVMADNDLYTFNAFSDSYRWYGYADFLPVLDAHLLALRALPVDREN